MPALHPWTPLSLAARSEPQLCPPSWRPAEGESGLRGLLQPQRAGGERSRFVPYVSARQDWDRIREAHGSALEGSAVWEVRLGPARWLAGLVRLDAPGISVSESVEPWAVQDRQRLLEALRAHAELPLALCGGPAPDLEPQAPPAVRIGSFEISPAPAGLLGWLEGRELEIAEGGAVWLAAHRLFASLRPRDRVRAEEFIPLAIALHPGPEPLPAGLLAWALDDWRPV